MNYKLSEEVNSFYTFHYFKETEYYYLNLKGCRASKRTTQIEKGERSLKGCFESEERGCKPERAM